MGFCWGRMGLAMNRLRGCAPPGCDEKGSVLFVCVVDERRTDVMVGRASG